MSADVWIVRLEKPLDPDLADSLLAWLAPAAREKHRRFATPGLRDEYLVTRALCRAALSRRVPGVHPKAWRFERTSDDRPFVAGPVAAPDFNLSNTVGMVVCAVSESRVGIDVEAVAAGSTLLENAHELFSPDENDELEALPPAERPRRAVELWTSKEAYLKARGDGISTHVRDVTIARPVWDIALVRVIPLTHVIAVARRAQDHLPPVSVHELSPAELAR